MRLLATKLFVPSVVHGVVGRVRLDERLAAGTRGPLTLVCSAAGWGKTTLVADWLRRTGRRAGWLSLDEHDNDVHRFLAYLLAAVHQILPGVGTMLANDLQSTEDFDPQLALIELLNDIAEAEQEALLVLDDLHLVDSTDVQDLLTFIIDSVPPNLHLIVTTRIEPPLPLARLRARGRLVEIRVPDLRFTTDEARAFLSTSMGIELSKENVEALEVRTEGWIAGLQMAAISLRDRQDAPSFIESFAGSHRFILDYLMDEVLGRMSPERRQVLLQLSILRELSAPLVDAVTGRQDGRALLESLESQNLFLVPLDDRRETYRFHHLFGTLLRHEFDVTVDAADRAMLHERASVMLEELGNIEGATDHAIEAEAWDRAEALLVQFAEWQALRGHDNAVLDRLRLIPDDELRQRPRLQLKRAWILEDYASSAEVDESIVTITQWLEEHSDQRLEGEFSVFKGVRATSRGDFEIAARHFANAEGKLAKDTLEWGLFKTHRAGLELVNDRFARARQDADELLREVQRLTDPFVGLWARWFRAQIEMLAGDPLETIRQITGLVPLLEKEFGDHPPRSTGVGYVTLALAYYERGELDDAVEWLEKALELFDPRFDADQCSAMVLTQVRVEVARDPRGTGWSEALRHGEALLSQSKMHFFGAKLVANRVRVALNPRTLIDPKPLVDAWVSTLGMREELHVTFGGLVFPTTRRGFALALLGRCLAYQGHFDDAREILTRYLEQARAADRRLCMVEGALAMAELEHRAGRSLEVIKHLERAVHDANERQLIGPFFEHAPELLDKAATLARSYGMLNLSRRIENIDAGESQNEVESSRDVALNSASAKANNLAGEEDVLSTRELEVLQLVAEGCSNAEVGRRLFVAPSTVKKHLEHVYDKLDVRRRTQAVAKARTLGLL